MVCPVCPLGPHRSRKREMQILWTFSGWHIYPLLALEAGYCTERDINGLIKSAKIEECNGIPSLPTGPTQVTKTGNVGSVGVFRASHLSTFGPRGQGNALRGS